MSELHEECLRCGRKLKNPKAREVGYGKVCLRKAMEAEAAKDNHQEEGAPDERG